MESVTIERLNGSTVVVSFMDYIRAFRVNDLRLFGMTMKDMIMMRKMYLILGGEPDITEDNIQDVIDSAYKAMTGSK